MVGETPVPVRMAPPAPSAGAPVDDRVGLSSDLASRIGELVQVQDGDYGLVVERVGTGEQLVHEPRRPFPAGSVYKLGVAYSVLHLADGGQLSLGERLTIEDDDAVEAEPAGGLALSEEVTVREALRAMMSVSSNAAAHGLLRRVGRAQVNSDLAALGLSQTRLPLERSQTVQTTAADMALLLRLLAQDRILTDGSRRELRALLALPEPLDPLVNALPAGTEVLAKTGNLERSSNVAGLIATPSGQVIISIFNEDVDPGDARLLIADVARAVYQGQGSGTDSTVPRAIGTTNRQPAVEPTSSPSVGR